MVGSSSLVQDVALSRQKRELEIRTDYLFLYAGVDEMAKVTTLSMWIFEGSSPFISTLTILLI